MRETLFNWLGPWLPGADCLDLFAGTGALCLEALSRGAGSVVMVEQDRAVAENLRNNLAILNARNARVVETDALTYLGQPPEAFDIIFIDPPFQSDLIARSAGLVEERGWLKPQGLVYIEAPARLRELGLPRNWELIHSKRAGEVGYHLTRRRK